ncbi:MAG TPA: CocE/NonD family hydrolase [Actinomycetota bacterium]|nr:CocE/NonD family hydrolase [Actinomycetota bacterium]
MRRSLAACAAAFLLAALAPSVALAAEHTSTPATVTNPNDGTIIDIQVFQPAVAAPANQVPVILHSHGWGGSKSTGISGDIKAMLDAGLGVVSISQRGHGNSGGQANVQDPTMETEDIKAVIDHIATLDWVLHDTDAAGTPIANDPVLGAIGGSYGGGYQTMTTLDEIADQGRTRLDALAPEITWYDLPESLAPQHVPRSAWDTVLYAAGAGMLPDYVHVAQAWGTTTNQWPDGTIYGQPVEGVPNLDAEFHKHSPVSFAERGIKIDVPVLIKQGTTDNLFNLNEGLNNFHKALTDDARAESYFVAFNGGHALPNVAPPGNPADLQLGGGVDACSGDWTQLRIDFFKRVFAGTSTDGLLPNQYNFTDLDGTTCHRFDAIDNSRTVAVEPLTPAGTVSTTGLGAPLHIEIADGPITVTGVPKLAGNLVAAGLDSRAFFGLSTGTSPADARVVQNNLLPLRQILPTGGEGFEIELPGVSVQVPEGEKLFLTISAFSDMYFGHSSKPVGGLVLSDMTLTLPKPATVSDPDPDPVATTMTLALSGRGSSSQLVATLTDPTGAGVSGATVDFFGDDNALGSAITDGDGTATLPLEGKYRGGHHEFEAVFGGNSDYAGSSGSTSS